MYKKMKRLPITCLAVMLGLASGLYGSLNSAHAQATIPQAVALDCAGDINNFCRNITIGGGRFHKCLSNNRDKLENNCQTVLSQAEKDLQ